MRASMSAFFVSAFTQTISHPDSPSFGGEHRLGLDTGISGEMSPVDSCPGLTHHTFLNDGIFS
ncbi:hypothetical protein QCA50_008168 [Cerrena zonata]|uniref:Uncharacterized protein n=1 Tax=Cerrena zonata TaxID=2478898 RepID=A0AAW0GI54_9APHY